MMIIALKWRSTALAPLGRGNPGDGRRAAWISRAETCGEPRQPYGRDHARGAPPLRCHILGIRSVMEA
ncbi:hypothetical protein Shyd_46110 [Streptomyces hydrogenans]|uniref:Uncharacterized protein n=1 Tax=Streptomyces hydrogenans TaxID=1873719 RepID=A0ABQ3PE08_9ACTN|nr:hypothetical protein GCM10018784_74680 [Streptomyces hydrogenans]GHI23240.1 hypothetical protein Shyd_46110 [Streptomyces hydrogenans]